MIYLPLDAKFQGGYEFEKVHILCMALAIAIMVIIAKNGIVET
jgi:hypothetical protein